MKTFITFLLFAGTSVGCNELNRGTGLPVTTSPLDTLAAPAAVGPAQPQLFQTAFIKGTTATINESVLSLYGVHIGNLKVPSGRVIACDPMHIDEYGIPFTQAFPTGEFPVHLAVAKLDLQEMVAFARIQFSKEPVVRWEFALQPGQEPLPVGGKKKHGYSVDAGVGVFIDEQSAKALDLQDVTETDRGIYPAMQKNYRNSWRFTLYPFGTHNLATFSSGFGDGHYASYIGFDAKGAPCQLLTDFELFPASVRFVRNEED